MVTPGRSRRLRNCRNFCDASERGGGGLGVLVLRAPALPLADGVEDHGDVGVVVGPGVGPNEPRRSVRQGDAWRPSGRGRGASIPAESRVSRTTSARSALCWSTVLPDQSREGRTRRVTPRLSRSWPRHPALAGDQAGLGVVGLDAVAEPVRAPGRARQEPEFGVQPVQVPGVDLIVGVAVGFPDGFGEVLGEVADGLVGVLGDDALQVELRAEPHHMCRPGVWVGVERVERLLPRWAAPRRCRGRRSRARDRSTREAGRCRRATWSKGGHHSA